MQGGGAQAKRCEEASTRTWVSRSYHPEGWFLQRYYSELNKGTGEPGRFATLQSGEKPTRKSTEGIDEGENCQQYQTRRRYASGVVDGKQSSEDDE